MRDVKTRKGFEFWDRICALKHYGFIHSPDNTRVLKAEGLGNWIDMHEAQQIVDQAQDRINDLEQSEALANETVGLALRAGTKTAQERDALQSELNQARVFIRSFAALCRDVGAPNVAVEIEDWLVRPAALPLEGAATEFTHCHASSSYPSGYSLSPTGKAPLIRCSFCDVTDGDGNPWTGASRRDENGVIYRISACKNHKHLGDAAISAAKGAEQPAPTTGYTAVDMSTAAAQGFRDGQAAAVVMPDDKVTSSTLRDQVLKAQAAMAEWPDAWKRNAGIIGTEPMPPMEHDEP